MDATFDIQVDPARHLVRIRLTGFFTTAAMTGFLAARADAFARLRCPVTDHLALTDVREIKIQSQAMVGAFGTLLANPSTRARRLAFVVAGTLARNQLQRAMGRRDARCFTDACVAEHWVLSSELAAAT